jgi:hypothetical protein
MTFTSWDRYADLLVKIGEERDSWIDTRSLAEFDERIRNRHSALVDGDRGFAALLTELHQEFPSDENLVYEQIKLVALARSGTSLGLGEEWNGYVVSERIDGTQAYSVDRYAPPSHWARLEVPTGALSLVHDKETGLMYDSENWYLRDGTTVVWPDPNRPGVFYDAESNTYVHGEPEAASVADLREQHFDEESGRWRRYSDEGSAFEYYHDKDGAWERWHDDLRHRLHDGAGRWLAYDENSETWLHDNEWRSYDAVTNPVPVTNPAPVAPATETVTPPTGDVPVTEAGQDDEPVTAVETADEFMAVVASSFEEAVAAIRAEDISEEEVSDDEIFALFEEHVEQRLASEIPEFRQLMETD